MYITHRILKKPSILAPVRQHKLLTMAPLKKLSKKDKPSKDVRPWCNRTGQTYDPTIEQYSMYPRAIADVKDYHIKQNGPTKVTKRYIYTYVPRTHIPSLSANCES